MTIEECTTKELQRLEARLHARDLPGADAARGRPGQPFPYISGLSLSLGRARRRPGDRRGAVRARQGARGPRPLRRRRAARLVPLEAVIAHFLPSLFPGMEIAERARLPRHARRRLRGLRRRRRPARGRRVRAAAPPLRRRRPASRSRRRPRRGCCERLRDGLGVDDDQVYEIEGLLDLADLMQLTRLDRPDLKDEPWVPVTQPRLARVKDAAPALRRDPARRPARAPAVRVVPDELRGLRRSRRRRSRRDRDEDGGLPHLRRQRARLGADRLRRAGQAGGLPRRAEGALRRAAQHRVVARARAGGRPRRPRLPGHEDPREDDARRPARGRRPAALRPHRHRQLPRRDGAPLRGRRASSRPTRRSPPTSPTSSTT